MNNLPRSVSCPVELSLILISGKWKPVILAHLKERPLRYGELRKLVPRLSEKMLTQRLAELQALGFVARSSRGGAYRLTEKGKTLRPVLQSLYDWGEIQARELGISVSQGQSLHGAPAASERGASTEVHRSPLPSR